MDWLYAVQPVRGNYDQQQHGQREAENAHQDLQRAEHNQPNCAVFRWVASQPRPFNNVFKELFHGWMELASMGWKLFKVGFSALSDGVDFEADIE